MAMKRVEEVGYQKFRVAPVLSEGLLAVERDDGGPQRRVAAAFGRLAEQAGAFGDRYAAAEGQRAGLADALANGPGGAVIEGGPVSGEGLGGGGAAVAGGAEGLPSGSAHAVAASILRKEEGFRTTPYWDVNAFRTGYGSDTITRADGSVVRVAKGMTVTREDAERDLARRLPEFEARARRAGGKAWDGLGDTTKGALLSVVYNYGSLPSSVAKAVRTGDTGSIANAVASLSANKRRRQSEADIIRRAAGAAPSAQPAPAAAPATAQAMVPEQAKTGAAAAIERQITPAEVAPPSVTPVSIEPGKAGGFRPTASLTIRGQAYDAAGTRTYLEELDATMRSDVSKVYDKFKDDPVALQQGFDALRTVHKEDHLFPEIQADYESAYGKMVEPYRRQALADQEKRALISNRAEFLTRTQELETNKQRAIETFDADNEDSAGALASVQSSIDAHYDSAVARGVMDADDAVKAKAESRSEAAIGFYGKQANTMKSAEDVLALRETLRKDFAAGELEGVDAAAWQKLDAGIGKIARSRQTGEKMAKKELTERGEGLADAILKGASPSSPEISKFMLDAKTAPGGSAIVKTAMDRMGTAQLLRDKTLEEGSTLVRELEADAGHQASGLAGFARKAYSNLSKGVEKDPIGAAETRGIVGPQAALFDAGADMGSIASSMKARLTVADTVAEHFGVTAKYLRPGEAEGLKKLAEQDPDAAAQIAGGLVAGAGNRVGQVLAELGNDAPALRQAGVILAGGGSPQAARDVIAGYAKGPDGKARPQISKEIRDTANSSVFGDAFAGSPRDGSAIEATAHAMARTRVTDSGAEPKSEEAGVIYRQALQEAAGAVYEKGVQYGGVVDIERGGGWFGIGSSKAKTIVPPSIRADRFTDVIDSIRDQDLVPADGERGRVARYFASPPVDAAGKPYRAADLKAARPVAVRGGYRFAMGDPASDDPQWIRAADGAPFVMAIDAMRDRLEARVPGAFR